MRNLTKNNNDRDFNSKSPKPRPMTTTAKINRQNNFSIFNMIQTDQHISQIIEKKDRMQKMKEYSEKIAMKIRNKSPLM